MKAEGDGLFQLGEEKALGKPDSSHPILRGSLINRKKSTFDMAR